jgi:hypothetical protein
MFVAEGMNTLAFMLVSLLIPAVCTIYLKLRARHLARKVKPGQRADQKSCWGKVCSPIEGGDGSPLEIGPRLVVRSRVVTGHSSRSDYAL